MTLAIRIPESIYRTEGTIEKGTFRGRWHFSFGDYFDPKFVNFGTLRVFNDDTLSRGAVWPLHPHKEIEVVTYCIDGEFRHADERGIGGILQKGWVQQYLIPLAILAVTAVIFIIATYYSYSMVELGINKVAVTNTQSNTNTPQPTSTPAQPPDIPVVGNLINP